MDSATFQRAVEAAVNVALQGSRALGRLEKAARSPQFRKAVEMLYACRGMVYVIGMGKSGLVGQKMAATFASTGTPASFLHAGEALHGDLGALRSGDVAILISKSGQTREILAALDFLKAQRHQCIGITNELGSTLAEGVDVALALRVDAEGCPLNLAPMTSTAATMTIGDMLAAALIVARDFKPESFARLHPGGKLGFLLTARVGDLLGPNSKPMVKSGVTLRQAVVALVESRLGAVLIVDGAGALVGMLTDGDLKRIMISGASGALDAPVDEVMTRNPTVAAPDMTAAEALELMERRERQISVLPVVDKSGHPLGVLRLHDVIRSGL